MIEKKNSPKKIGKIEDIENFLFELEKLAESVGDDAIRISCMNVIDDVCIEHEICTSCFTKIDEVWLNEGLYRHCNCKSKFLSGREAV